MKKKTILWTVGLAGTATLALVGGVFSAGQASGLLADEATPTYRPFILGNKANDANHLANKAYLNYYADTASCRHYSDSALEHEIADAEIEKDFSYEAASSSEVASDDKISTLSMDMTKQNGAFRNLDQATSQQGDGGTAEYVKDDGKVCALFSRTGDNAPETIPDGVYKNCWSQWQFETPERIKGFSFDYKYLDSGTATWPNGATTDGTGSERNTHAWFQYRATNNYGATSGAKLDWCGYALNLTNDGQWNHFSTDADSAGAVAFAKSSASPNANAIDRLVFKIYDFRGALIISNLHYNVPDTYSFTLPTGTGYTAAAVSGYDPAKVYQGDDFKFTVTGNDDLGGKMIYVYNGSTELTPDADGVYTLSNIQEAPSLRVETVSIVDDIFSHYSKYFDRGTVDATAKTIDAGGAIVYSYGKLVNQAKKEGYTHMKIGAKYEGTHTDLRVVTNDRDGVAWNDFYKTYGDVDGDGTANNDVDIRIPLSSPAAADDNVLQLYFQAFGGSGANLILHDITFFKSITSTWATRSNAPADSKFVYCAFESDDTLVLDTVTAGSDGHVILPQDISDAFIDAGAIRFYRKWVYPCTSSNGPGWGQTDTVKDFPTMAAGKDSDYFQTAEIASWTKGTDRISLYLRSESVASFQLMYLKAPYPFLTQSTPIPTF